ncbi:response regulator transcription factor [Patescibacteria group bacterium]|nr:response regulator transcription factor [Patescibacteria group bacterium]
MRVLLIEDEEDLADFIVSLLKKSGLAVDLASDGERGSFLARTNHYDLIITDYILPKLDGRSLIKEIRDDGRQMPILMLSVRKSAADKSDILNVGADDYLAKPFSSEELLARVHALGRRSPNIKNRILTFKNITLDPDAFRVNKGNKNIKLTNKEFSLLQYLMLNAEHVVSREILLDHVWDDEIDSFSNTVETHILRLRRKLENKGEKIIHTVVGRGYRLDYRQ